MREIRVRYFFAPLLAALLGPCAPIYAQTVYLKFSQLQPSEIQQDLRSFPDGDAARELQLRKMFEQGGCDDADLREERFQRKDPPNIMCTLRGSSDSAIIVAAHTDNAEV